MTNPITLRADLEGLVQKWADGEHGTAAEGYFRGMCADELSAILSRATPSAPSTEHECAYAERLARYLWREFYAESAPQWEPFSGDLMGLLSQIDNMIAGIPQATPSADGVVTDADVDRAYGAYRINCCTEAFPWLERSAMRAALQAYVESLAPSLPTKVPDVSLTREQVIELLSLACEEIDVINVHLRKMLSAAPSPKECEHEWIDATNSRVSGTAYCPKCGKLASLGTVTLADAPSHKETGE